MVNLWFVGSGGDTPQGDLEANVSQQVRGIKWDKQIQSRLIVLLIRRRKSTHDKREKQFGDSRRRSGLTPNPV
jgi:hypothetical protein